MDGQPSDSPAAVFAAELEFKADMRVFGRRLGGADVTAPDVLAERFHAMAVSISRQWPAGAARDRYRAGVRAEVSADRGLGAVPGPLYERFLARLGTLLDGPDEPGRP